MRQNDNVLYAAHSCSFLLVNFNLTMQRLDLPRSAMTMATMLIFGPSGYYLHPLWRRRYYNTLGIDYLFTHIPIQTQPPPCNHNIIILSAISTLPPPLPPTAAASSMTNFRHHWATMQRSNQPHFANMHFFAIAPSNSTKFTNDTTVGILRRN